MILYYPCESCGWRSTVKIVDDQMLCKDCELDYGDRIDYEALLEEREQQAVEWHDKNNI